ncbi:hypothetical protein [Italian clover phyllody phytoplasma]|uniref:hypothetical protein n=1 Tax=Italian clover phyllody phytoplasma TaxID=1196420 RepID=UPI0002FF1822|nr:hypothetical protein [Italian clover phyllody phytoplasma]
MLGLLLFFIIYFSFFYNKEQKNDFPTEKLVSDVQKNLEEYVEPTYFNDNLDNQFQEKLDENKLTKEEEKQQEKIIIEESQNEELNTEDTMLNSDEEAITDSKGKTKKNTKWSLFRKKSKKNDKKDEQANIIEKNSDSSEVEDKIQEEMTIQQEKTQK